MEPLAGDFAWLSILQKRADFARKSAEKAHSPEIAHEFEELAALYQEAMDAQKTPPEQAKDDIIRYLQARSHEFLLDARGLVDEGRADRLKYLAGAFGAEAARLRNR
jgi:hypothetical protein